MVSHRRVLIVGCGYVGLELGRQLALNGHRVFGLRRSTGADAELVAAGCVPLQGDLTDLSSLQTLPGPFDWVVNTVSSSRGGPDAYRQVFCTGMENLIDAARTWKPEALVYTSSTSVYGQTDGSWVDESAPTVPGTETGRWLAEAERLLTSAADRGEVPSRLLRVAGIYGPGRGHLFQQFLRGEARLSGDGSRWLNMIHRDDVATAIMAVLERGRSGEIYNVADTEPVSQLQFLTWLADQLRRPLPPVASPESEQSRKRGITHKRVSAAKLRTETGWTPRYPSYREGYAEAIAQARAQSASTTNPPGN